MLANIFVGHSLAAENVSGNRKKIDSLAKRIKREYGNVDVTVWLTDNKSADHYGNWELIPVSKILTYMV